MLAYVLHKNSKISTLLEAQLKKVLLYEGIWNNMSLMNTEDIDTFHRY